MFFCGSTSVCFDTLTLLLLEKGNKFTDFIIKFSISKESACHAEDLGLIPGSGRIRREGNGYPLQYSYLENSMDRGVWQATVHGVTKSQIQLNTHTLLTRNPLQGSVFETLQIYGPFQNDLNMF